MSPDIAQILKAFGLNDVHLRKPPDAKLARVYLVEDRYVLRSRPLEPDTPLRFAAECELCDAAAKFSGYRFPQYKACTSGVLYVVKDGFFWTLHQLIPGRPLGSWFDLHRVTPSVHRQVMQALKRLHAATTGCFDEESIDRTRLLELVAPALVEAPDYLSANAMRRARTAYERVAQFCGSFPGRESCFVHGDFHHGNILAQGDSVVGFIDLDWCRIGSPYEDLSFTLMMLLRDFENWSHEFRWSVYYEMLESYRFKGDAGLLNEHLILYALFDCLVFKAAGFDRAEAFHEYQKGFMEAVCRNLTEAFP